MSRPKFSVGETIIREAPRTNYPELNGEYVILDIATKTSIERITSCNLVFWDEGFYYELEGFQTGVELFAGKWSIERFLRKKHTPASGSFTSMMDKLKIGETI